ncbi:Transposase, Mutator family [Methylobacterium pseudosasicola]|uniref:Transposase, Mutator family n=1 Tax=Methylobacterium pseudosasicola TaxID=582667 RepID=A0A1I4I4F5_9HYPH|nr:Transposase, Mutator family [Methylobacterium pseudosasicola]
MRPPCGGTGRLVENYEVKDPRAAPSLTKDWEALVTIYDLPGGHWDHLHGWNLIASVFATVRDRMVRTKGALSSTTAKRIVFKLVMTESKTWRRLKGEGQLLRVVAGVIFRDGTEVTARPADRAA